MMAWSMPWRDEGELVFVEAGTDAAPTIVSFDVTADEAEPRALTALGPMTQIDDLQVAPGGDVSFSTTGRDRDVWELRVVGTEGASELVHSRAFAGRPPRLLGRRGESGRFEMERLQDITMAGLRLGIVTGYYYGEDFARLMEDESFAAQIDPAVDYDTNIRKLLHGRIDGFIVDDVGVMVSAVRTLGVEDQVERHPLVLPGDDLHFMFSRKSVDTLRVEGVNQVIARMRNDGRLSDIMRKHLE